MARKEDVTKVIDGDTFETSSRKKPIRLANVDTPEKGEPGYMKAKQKLTNLIKGKKVSIDTVARDSYGRSVAKVRAGGKSVNNAMKGKAKK